MPPPSPDPGHPAIQGLDPAFKEAPELAVWIDWLLHPERDDTAPRIFEGYEVDSKVALDEDESTVLPGVHIEQLFDPAYGLSGQSLYLFEHSYTMLNEYIWKGDDQNSQLNNGVTLMLASWKSDDPANTVTQDVSKYFGSILDFYVDHTRAVAMLRNCFLAYGSIIQQARKDLNTAMVALTDAFQHRYYARESPMKTIAITAAAAIATGAIGLATGGTAAPAMAAAWGQALIEVASEAAKESRPEKDIRGDTWLNVVRSYYVAQAFILDSARDALDEQVLKKVNELMTHMPAAPALPANVTGMANSLMNASFPATPSLDANPSPITKRMG